MAIPTIEAVTERLDGLERENRRLRRIATFLLAGLLGVGALAAATCGRRGRTIEAQNLVLRDREGRLRGSFGVDRSGLPSLKIFDHRGQEQITLGAESEDFATLTLCDRGAPRMLLSTSIEGTTSVRLLDGSQDEKASLFLKPNSEAGFRIASGEQAVSIGLGADGRMTVLTTDAEGHQADRLLPATSTEFGRDLPAAVSSPIVQRPTAGGRRVARGISG